MRRFAFALGVVVSTILLTAAPARAHASLLSSEPAAGEELSTAPSHVVLALSERVDPAASEIRVLSTDGKLVSREQPTLSGGLRLQVRLAGLPEGVYTVTWRVLSRVDGHVTGGSFAFGVGVSPADAVLPEGDVGRTPGPTPAGTAGRWLFYAGIALVIGVAGLTLFAHPGTPPMARALWLGWTAALAGIALIAWAQASDSGVGIRGIFTTSIGPATAARAVPLGIAAAALLLVRPMRLRAIVAALAACAAVGMHVSNGHAGAGGLRAVVIQSVHFVAAAVWIGGLAALASTLRASAPDERARAAVRYSAIALWAVVVLLGTGVARALTENQPLRLLWTTGYGRLVLLKAGLLAVMVVLGAINRYRMVPRAHTDHGGLRRVALTELVVAVAVLAATSVLTSIAPARTAVAAPEQAVRATGSDAGTTIRAVLTATPGGPGPNRFELSLRDHDTGDVVVADRVTATFRLVGEDLEPASVDFVRSGDIYTADGSMLAVPGPWQVAVLVSRGPTTAEIRMSLFPRAQQPQSTIPGDPTIYVIALPDGRSAQMYVDPARAGQAEVHITWFEAGSKQFSELGEIVLIGTAPGQRPQVLPTRLLTPGHAVGDVTLTPGRWRFDASTTTRGGARLWAMFEPDVPS